MTGAGPCYLSSLSSDRRDAAGNALLNRTAGYALHAALMIAENHGPGRPATRARDVAASLDLPSNYLSKILHALTRAGVLVSERGRNGGFRLAKPASTTPLSAVIAPFDDLGAPRQCLLGHGACSDTNACPVHDEWRTVSAPAFRFFEQRTLADLMPKGEPLVASIPRRRRTDPTEG